MDEEDRQKIIIGAKLDEAKRLGDAIAERMGAAERFVAVAGSVGGIGLTLGLFQHQNTVLAVLPIIIGTIYLFMIQIYTDASMHTGHRRALEEHLAHDLGEKVLVAASEVATKHTRRLSVPLGLVLSMAIWALTAWIGLKAIFDIADSDKSVPDGLLIGGEFAVLLYAIAIIVIAVFENVHAEARGYSAAYKTLGEVVLPQPSVPAQA